MRRPRDKTEAQRIMAGIIEFYNNKRPHLNNEGKLPPRKLREKITGGY